MSRPRLLLLFVPADHPHRDPVCATLSWLGPANGRLFDCYFAAAASGTHYGGGHPAAARPEDLRGGTLTGGHHLEQLYRVLLAFDCEAAVLGDGPFDAVLEEACTPVLARSDDVADFYRQLLAALGGWPPRSLLVVGDGGRPQGVRLTPYAYPEVVNRRLLAIAEADDGALAAMSADHATEGLWLTAAAGGGPAAPPACGPVLECPAGASAAEQTAWMAERWAGWARGYLLGDPELVGRWTPTAARARWAPIFGIPQTQVIARMAEPLAATCLAVGRQQDDQDFLELSRLGVAFQLVDPGRPPFPVVREAPRPRPRAAPARRTEPDDDELERWAAEGRVVTSLLFWTGMIRELENLYAVADALSLTGLAAGLVLTTESFAHQPHPPLELLEVPRALGGLAPAVEPLLASGGSGAFLESATPPDRFASTLRTSVADLARRIGLGRVPSGWWGVMDSPLVPRRAPRLTRQPDPPYLLLRYRGRGQGVAPSGEPATRPEAGRGGRPPLRTLVRRSPLGRLLEPLRPFDAFAPGPPGRAVLEAVRAAGFAYAFTKAEFGGRPAVVDGVDGLTVLNYTVGRWDGWTPFVTINSLADLRAAERRLLRHGRPGWLIGTLDTCLWAFSGPRWHRGRDLLSLCAWAARGGDSGRLLNVPPRVAARYARILAERGSVRRVRPA